MDKGKVMSIFKQTEILTAMERAFLGKKLMKSIFRDLEYENGLINDLSRRTESANKCIGKLTKEIEQYKAKEAFDTLKDAEQKLKASGGIGVVENENNDTKTSTCTTGTITAKIAIDGIERLSNQKTETEDDDWSEY